MRAAGKNAEQLITIACCQKLNREPAGVVFLKVFAVGLRSPRIEERPHMELPFIVYQVKAHGRLIRSLPVGYFWVVGRKKTRAGNKAVQNGEHREHNLGARVHGT
jgi:hypothetical protein